MYFVIPFVLLIVFCAMSIVITKRENGVPMALGVSFMTISSKSMQNVGFNVGDKVFVKKNNPQDYKKGDYIAFFDYADPNCSYYTDVTENLKPRRKAETSKIVFHEIVQVFQDQNNNYWFRTKGSNNNYTDINLIYQDYVVGEYLKVGEGFIDVINKVTSIKGVFVFIVLPCCIILFKDTLTLVDSIFEVVENKKKQKIKE